MSDGVNDPMLHVSQGATGGDRRQRVLFVQYASALGGAEVATLRVARGLAAMGHVVGRIDIRASETAGPGDPEVLPHSYDFERTVDILHYLPRPRAARSQARALRRLRETVDSFMADAVVAVKSPVVMTLPFLYPSRDWRLVGTEHRRVEDLRSGRGWRDRAFRWQLANGIRRCDALVTVDQATADAARSLGAKEARVIPNPVPDALFCLPLARPRPKIVLIVGRLSPEKRIDLALGAWLSTREEDRKGWRLVVVGEGPERPRLEQLARADRQQSVWFRGAIDDLTETFRDARALLFPSAYELQGMAALEAMAAGVPLIVSAESAQGKDHLNSETAEIVAGGIPEWREALKRIVGSGADAGQGRIATARAAAFSFRSTEVCKSWADVLRLGS